MEGDERALDRITSTVARHGTTSIVATTVTAPVDETCRSLQGIARYIRAPRKRGNRSPRRRDFGHSSRRPVHQQGAPRRSSAGRARRRRRSRLLGKFIEAADGLVKIVTLAPELPGALELIAAAVAAKIVAAHRPHRRRLRSSARGHSRGRAPRGSHVQRDAPVRAPRSGRRRRDSHRSRSHRRSDRRSACTWPGRRFKC